jgi:hypothetical protein
VATVAVVVAVGEIATVVSAAAAATTANHAGKFKVKGKRQKSDGANCVLFDFCLCFWRWSFPAYFSFGYFLASGVNLNVSRCPPRINSTSYSCPAFISPSAYV